MNVQNTKITRGLQNQQQSFPTIPKIKSRPGNHPHQSQREIVKNKIMIISNNSIRETTKQRKQSGRPVTDSTAAQ
jgi:hypothetical protein